MTLPPAAWARLSQPLRAAAGRLTPCNVDVHTVPIGDQVWSRHSAGLRASIDEFVTALQEAPTGDSFKSVESWVGTVVDAAAAIKSITVSLEPFAPYDPAAAARILGDVTSALTAMAAAVSAGRPSWGTPPEVSTEWPEPTCGTGVGLLARTFGMSRPPVDGTSQFDHSRVFEAYKYRASDLLLVVAPHLRALHLPLVDDMLAMVSVPGLIVSADDQVIAYSAMSSWVAREPATVDRSVDAAVYAHLRRHEQPLHHSRDRTFRAIAALNEPGDLESKALELADVYRRLVEGPVRQYAWAMHSRSIGTWREPPTLAALRDVLRAAGGWLGRFAQRAVLPDFRNAVAHETLAWDGINECYVDGDRTVPLLDVLDAATLANSFARGCEAALAILEVQNVEDPDALPTAAQPGRAPEWRRARAFFGTNGLRLVDAYLNGSPARITVERIELEDINPLFQALLLTHRLIPAVGRFEVSTSSSGPAVVTVDAEALEATAPVWEDAVRRLSGMPLSTFLPANLNARSRIETLKVAARSVAWIAADDFLDAVDHPTRWDAETHAVLEIRTRIVRTALRQCLPMLPASDTPRLAGLLKVLDEIADSLPMRPGDDPDRLPAVGRVRLHWQAWGPVRRLPNVLTARTTPDDPGDARPAMRVPAPSWARL